LQNDSAYIATGSDAALAFGNIFADEFIAPGLRI